MKAGKLFERVVAEVAKAMEPDAIVAESTWIQGPDGRREIDVLIVGRVDGSARTPSSPNSEISALTSPSSVQTPADECG